MKARSYFALSWLMLAFAGLAMVIKQPVSGLVVIALSAVFMTAADILKALGK